jgi:hypothetical protein
MKTKTGRHLAAMEAFLHYEQTACNINDFPNMGTLFVLHILLDLTQI